MPYFTHLAREFTISDNYHQPVMGGTGANSIMIGTADAIYYTDSNGNPAKPPVNQIENPLPMAGTNNWYTQDGYSGGSYSNCSDLHQPGVGTLRHYLSSLSYKPDAKCAPNTYYLLNNYNPGYNGDGTVNTSTFTIPPSPVRTIGDTLLEKSISWKYYGEGWNTFVSSPSTSVYCNICNPFLYEKAIMTNPAVVKAHLQDTSDLYSDITNGTLPAVSFVKPGGLLDGTRSRRSSACMKPSCTSSWTRCSATRRCGPPRRSSLPRTKAAATTIRATSSRSTSSATVRAFRSSSCRRTRAAAAWCTSTRITCPS